MLDERELRAGAKIIRDGGTVAFRTETVYGLGADATSEDAVRKIFNAKGRPTVNPLIVHFASLESLFEFFPDIDTLTRKVIKSAKSALTVIIPRPNKIPAIVSGGLDTVAVRVPECSFARRFIKACGVPLAAPSANTSTRPSPTRWQDVFDDLNGRIGAIFKGPQTRIGVESTVVRINEGTIDVLRLGGCNTEKLSKMTGLKVSVASNKEHTKSSPGTAFKHYAPNCDFLLVRYTDDMTQRINDLVKGKKAVVLCIQQNKSNYPNARVISLGSTAKQIAKNLFVSIREGEKYGDIIICESFPDTSEFETVNERVRRASSGKVI